MNYKCGHKGCDICGGRKCDGLVLTNIGEYIVCKYCVQKAIKLAIHVSESFSTYIDLDKPCGDNG